MEGGGDGGCGFGFGDWVPVVGGWWFVNRPLLQGHTARINRRIVVKRSPRLCDPVPFLLSPLISHALPLHVRSVPRPGCIPSTCTHREH